MTGLNESSSQCSKTINCAGESHPQPPTATHGLGAGFDLNNFHNPGGLSQVLSLEVSIEADVEPPTSQIPAL
jgi:hypothetical protein